MKVRLTSLMQDEDVAVEGEAVGPPEIGKPYTVLVLSVNKVFTTGTPVSMVGFDRFLTKDGTFYSWAREVGQA